MLANEGTELPTIVERLRAFLRPPKDAIISGDNFELSGRYPKVTR
jgi:hypothetical protein